jgi:hypothetical protein
LAKKLGDDDEATAQGAAHAMAAIARRDGERPRAVALLERGRKVAANRDVAKAIDTVIAELSR